MPYNIMKYDGVELPCFTIWQNGFSEDELEKILFLEKLQTFQKGKTGKSNKDSDKKIRDSEVSWLVPDANSDWLFSRLSGIISQSNHRFFMYDIDGIESIQYTKYNENQHYTWHWDVSFGWQSFIRKISVVVMLSDPDEYEGGELEICYNGNFEDTQKLKLNKGDAVLFASWMPHKVHPVISGNRKTLVTWVMGKREC